MIKAIESDLNTVPEALRPYYVERDGRHILNVEPVEGYALENVNGLKTALAAERRGHGDAEAGRREAMARLDAYGDLDPVAARAALSATSADIDALVAARAEGMRSAIAESAGAEARSARSELDATRATLKTREKQLERLTRDAAISSELDRLKPLDDARDVLVMLAGQHIRMIESDGEMAPVVIDATGAPKLDAEGKPVSIRKFMRALREERQSLFQPEHKVEGLGGRAGEKRPPSTGGEANPWSKATFNRTQQAIISARDPARAARLQAEAV